MSTQKSLDFKSEVFEAMPGLVRQPHTGNRWIVTLPEQYGGGSAILKTSATAAMMVIAENGDADAPLVGIERGIDPSLDKILAAMKTEDDVIHFYLLDRQMVVDRMKANHGLWQERKPDSLGNKNRVLYFRNYKLPSLDVCAHVHDDWNQYLILSVNVDEVASAVDASDEAPQRTPADAVQVAKEMVADAYGIDAGQVSISVDL